MNREAWLTEVSDRVKPVFKGFTLRPFRVTCGWPSSGALGKTIGQCHYPPPDKDGFHDLFVSPLIDQPVEAAGILVHEMVHVVAGHKAAHGKGFKRVALHIGLNKGKMTSASPGNRLKERLEKIVEEVGSYPHTKIVGRERPKKSPTMTKLECVDCEYKLSVSKKMLEEHGPPTCPCGKKFTERE